jgi:hypothetical protein
VKLIWRDERLCSTSPVSPMLVELLRQDAPIILWTTKRERHPQDTNGFPNLPLNVRLRYWFLWLASGEPVSGCKYFLSVPFSFLGFSNCPLVRAGRTSN